MEQWHKLTNNLVADFPTTSLSSIVSNIASTLGAESTELFRFDNNFAFSNININDYKTPLPGVTFVNQWQTGFAWDLKGAWNWGVGENLAPETYKTTSIKFAPNVYL